MLVYKHCFLTFRSAVLINFMFKRKNLCTFFLFCMKKIKTYQQTKNLMITFTKIKTRFFLVLVNKRHTLILSVTAIY